MSGSTRSIVLRLSVAEAETVRARLEQMGAVGEAALKKLEVAAARTTQATSDFVPAVQRAAVESDRAAGVFGRAGQAMGSLGYQAQDAAIQIGMGTNALTVMAQQGSQFLGVFGTGGAIAGATLAIGVLAYQLLAGKDATEQFNEAAKKSEGLYQGLEAAADRYTASIDRQRKKLIELQQQIAATDTTERDYQLRQAKRAETDMTGALSAFRRRAESSTSFLPDDAAMARLRELNSATNQIRSQTGQAPIELDAGLLQLQRAREDFRRSSPEDVEAYGKFATVLETVAKNGGEAGKRAKEFLDALDKDYPNARKTIDELTRNRDLQALLRGETPLALGSAPTEPGEDTSAQERRAASAAERAAKRASATIQKNAETLQQSWDSFWDSADKRSEERQGKEFERREQLAKQEQDKREREAEAILRRQQAQAERSTDEIVRYGADMFADMFSSTEGGWDRMWTNMRRTATAIIARIAAEAIIRPIIAPVVSGLFSSAASGGAALTGAGQIAGGGLGGLTDILGLAGSANSASSFLGLGGIGSRVSSLMGTPLWSSGAQSAGELAFLGQAGITGSSVTTLGSVLGGAGLGFGAGAMLNSLVGGKSTGGMVGSGAGALAGAAIGSIIPGVGTVIGGLIGGAGGGLLGGMFGPGAPNPASSVQLGIDANGQLVVMGSKAKGMSAAEGIAAANSTAAGLNSAISGRGLTLRPSGGAVAQTLQGNDADPTRDKEELTRVVLSSLTGGSEAVMNIIAREIAKGAAASIDQAFSDIDWVKSVYEPLSSTTPAISEFESAINALNTTYGEAIRRAQDLGLATADLASNQARAIAEATAARDLQYSQTGNSFVSRLARAQGNTLGADLLDFDVAAEGQRASLRAQLAAQGATGQAYDDQFRRLEDALWTERKAIAERGAAELLETERRAAEEAQRAREAATSSATGVITSLADYARSLAVGSSSPLSSQDQFGLAERQFNAVAGSAAAGDANSISQLRGYADTYLSASRSLYGSTAGYAASFQRVQDVLGQVGGVAADTLTASFLATQTQDLKTSLVAELQALRAAVDDLKREQMQGNSRPRAA